MNKKEYIAVQGDLQFGFIFTGPFTKEEVAKYNASMNYASEIYKLDAPPEEDDDESE